MTAGAGSSGSGQGNGRGGPSSDEGLAPPHGVQLPPRPGAVQPGSAVPPPVKVIEMEDEGAKRRARALGAALAVVALAVAAAGALWWRSAAGR